MAGLVCGAFLPPPGALAWICSLSVAAQLWIIFGQLKRRNFLTAGVGFCLTAMLLMGVLAPRMYQPSDLNGYLTAGLLDPSLTALAERVLLMSSGLYYVTVALLAPLKAWSWSRPDPVEWRAANAAAPVLLVSGVALLFLTRPGALITSVPYPFNEATGAGALASNSGLDFLAVVLLSLALVAASRAYGFSSTAYRLVLGSVLAAVLYFRFLRGDRAFGLVVFSTPPILYCLCSKMSRAGKLASVAAMAAGLFLLFTVWASVRWDAASAGFRSAVERGWQEKVLRMPGERFDPLSVQQLPQAYWHLLDAEYLVENGLSARGATVYALVPQIIPESLARQIHFQRPINGARLLMRDGVRSGGGMYVVAEGFWNFGMPGALGVGLALGLIAAAFEAWGRRQEPLVAGAYLAFIGSLGMGIFYGLEPLARALEVTAALAFAGHKAMRVYRSRDARRLRRCPGLAKRPRSVPFCRNARAVGEPPR